MDVTDVLRDRMQEPTGLQKMVTLSLVAHAIAGAGFMLTPGHLIGTRREEPANAMRISIAGSEGPANGGMTTSNDVPLSPIEIVFAFSCVTMLSVVTSTPA